MTRIPPFLIGDWVCATSFWDTWTRQSISSEEPVGNPWLSYTHLTLAAALGLKGELDEASTALAEAISLKPEINSLARLRAYVPYDTNLPRGALREQTFEAGLRNAGTPEE